MVLSYAFCRRSLHKAVEEKIRWVKVHLIHRSWVTHICASNQVIISLNNGLPPHLRCKYLGKCWLVNSIPIKISLKCAPKVSINNIPGLVQIMAWRRPGNKPLSEPMMLNLPIYASLGLNELKRQTAEQISVVTADLSTFPMVQWYIRNGTVSLNISWTPHENTP